jgi:hypothetical protein
VAAVALAARGGRLGDLVVVGAVLGIATAVKSPAAVAAAFAVPIWLHARRQRIELRSVAMACAATLAGLLLTFGIASAVSGLGLGWTKQASADITVVNWMSVPTLVAMLAKLASGTVRGSTRLDDTMRTLRTAGEAVAVAVIGVLWCVALRRAALACMTVALGALAVLAPATQPWYYCWALAFAGLIVTRRWVFIALATVSVIFPVMFRPNGHGFDMKPLAAVIIVGGALAVLLLLGRASAPHDDRPEHAGAQVRPDDGT